MSIRQDYQQFAHECLRFAYEAKNDKQRQLFLQMADAWTMVAFEGPFAVERTAKVPDVGMPTALLIAADEMIE
jgi:hypothetical protein